MLHREASAAAFRRDRSYNGIVPLVEGACTHNCYVWLMYCSSLDAAMDM